MDKWSFQESFIWGNTYPKCSAQKQSPINIDTELVTECKTLCSFEINYKPNVYFHLFIGTTFYILAVVLIHRSDLFFNYESIGDISSQQ